MLFAVGLIQSYWLINALVATVWRTDWRPDGRSAGGHAHVRRHSSCELQYERYGRHQQGHVVLFALGHHSLKELETFLKFVALNSFCMELLFHVMTDPAAVGEAGGLVGDLYDQQQLGPATAFLPQLAVQFYDFERRLLQINQQQQRQQQQQQQGNESSVAAGGDAKRLLPDWFAVLNADDSRLENVKFLKVLTVAALPETVECAVLLDVDIAVLDDLGELVAAQCAEVRRRGEWMRLAPEWTGVYSDEYEPWTEPMVDPPPLGWWGVNSGVAVLNAAALRQTGFPHSDDIRDRVLALHRRYDQYSQPVFQWHRWLQGQLEGLGRGPSASAAQLREQPHIVRRFTKSDQDFFNLLARAFPERVGLLPCGWNVQLISMIGDHRVRQCAQVNTLHGNGGAFSVEQVSRDLNNGLFDRALAHGGRLWDAMARSSWYLIRRRAIGKGLAHDQDAPRLVARQDSYWYLANGTELRPFDDQLPGQQIPFVEGSSGQWLSGDATPMTRPQAAATATAVCNGAAGSARHQWARLCAQVATPPPLPLPAMPGLSPQQQQLWAVPCVLPDGGVASAGVWPVRRFQARRAGRHWFYGRFFIGKRILHARAHCAPWQEGFLFKVWPVPAGNDTAAPPGTLFEHTAWSERHDSHFQEFLFNVWLKAGQLVDAVHFFQGSRCGNAALPAGGEPREPQHLLELTTQFEYNIYS